LKVNQNERESATGLLGTEWMKELQIKKNAVYLKS